MDIKLFLGGISSLLFGLLLFFDTMNNKPASSENGFKGELPQHYIKNKPLSFMFIIGGIVFIIESLTK